MTPKVVALTGGIGSGKSTVANYLKSKGYEVFDCDSISRQVADQEEVLLEVKELLGKQAIEQGKLNRAYIRQVLFQQDKHLLKEYNAIFFGRILKLLQQAINTSKSEIVFVEIAVLDAFPYHWYSVWSVQSDNDTRALRVAKRDGVSTDSANAVMSAQKQYASDVVIDNNGSLQQLYHNVDCALTNLLSK